MTYTIVETDDYKLVVSTERSIHNHFHTKIESQLKTAKNPEELRTVFSVTCNQAGLENLAREIYTAITKDAQ